MKALTSNDPHWSCQQLSPTSSEAERADSAANAAGNQFDGLHVDFDPARAREGGNPYAQFKCSTSQGEEFIWYQEVGGVWISLNGGLSASAVASGTTARHQGSGSDLYASCSDTVSSFHDMATDLRTYLANQSNTTTMHDDFAALGDDLELMGQQADDQGRDSAGVTFQNAAGAYSADAEEVDISGQLQSPPDGFGAALRGSCPHSFAAAGLTAGGNPSGGNTGSSATTTGSMVCADANAPTVRVTADGTTCAKADALLVALPDGPLGHQSFQGWSCDTPNSGGLTTCTLGAASATFLPNTPGQTGSGNSGSPSSPTSASETCATGPNSGLKDISAAGMSCPEALAAATQLQDSGCSLGDDIDSPMSGSCRGDGFECSERPASIPGPYTTVTCTGDDGRRLSFTDPA